MRARFAAAVLLLAVCESSSSAPNADDFIAGVNDDLRKSLPLFNAAQWVQSTYITEDTQVLGAKANEQYLEYTSRKLEQAKQFDDVPMSPETARGLLMLKLSTSMPAPSDAVQREELTKLSASLEAHYASAQWCRPVNGKEQCLPLETVEKILNDPKRSPQERREAWAGWHATARSSKADYQRFVSLMNTGAKEMGFSDTGELWRAGYDMSAAEFSQETERLWTQVQPLYEALHCYARSRLNTRYGDAVVPKNGLIPAHLLGNMWAQQWSNIDEQLEPYPGVSKLDATPTLKRQRSAEFKKLRAAFKGMPTPVQLAELEHQADAAMSVKMTKVAEDFYTSIGFPPLPRSFYERSMLTRPRDREVVCHASAWDINMQGDVRVKMCMEPTEDDLTTIHHEMGHIYYDLMYDPLPPLFQGAAHDGFHEAIGDTITLSLTPAHLHRIGLIGAQKPDPRALINTQMKLALDKIAFLPFGKLIDQWRWKVFSGEIKPENYNAAWWALREKYQGVSAPLARSEEDFDAGAKYHVASNTPYTRYFLSFILQFQFHKALCDAAGFKGPLYECDIYGSKDAGRKFMTTLAAGASRPWQETLEKLTGTREMSAAAITEYFAPLLEYLKQQNSGESCGWAAEKAP